MNPVKSKEENLMEIAIGESLGVSPEDVGSNKLGDLVLDGEDVEYTDFLYIFRGVGINNDRLSKYFDSNTKIVTNQGRDMLTTIAGDVNQSPDEYFKWLELIGERETLAGDYSKKDIRSRFEGFRGQDLTLIADYIRSH